MADSPLEFTAQQRKMVVGFSIAYKIAVETGQDTAVALFLLGGAAQLTGQIPLSWETALAGQALQQLDDSC